jgi:DNA-3-methyladenine glycosylase
MPSVNAPGLKNMQSNMRTVPFSFFNRSALLVAKELLSCYLVINTVDGIQRYLITETEAYIGPHDLASHSSKGRTKRTEIMYQAGGTIYVYLIYGLHNMLNIVTGNKDYPAAVLIRAIEDTDENFNKLIKGPGNVAKVLHVDRLMNGKLLGKQANLWVEFPTVKTKRKIKKTPRIGIDYAGPIWSQKEYRFVLEK